MKRLISTKVKALGNCNFLPSVFLALCFISIVINECKAATATFRPPLRPVATNLNSNNNKNLNSNSNINGNSNSNSRVSNRPLVMAEAFANAGKKAGIEIWRIEDFEPKAYPANNYGAFYSGDSYIILFTRERKGTFTWDIHFWLGKETSQDEAGAAAIYAVQLDDMLGGAPTQHREVQEHESQTFVSYFKNGIRYLSGGVASGFTHVDRNNFEKRLFHVKGKRNVRVKQVPLSVASMNTGDCFILDVGKDVYIYTGKTAKRAEKLKAISAANQIRDQDHSGRARVHILDETATEDEILNFFTLLGEGSPASVPDESAGGSDEESDAKEQPVSLSKVAEVGGRITVTSIAQKPLRQNMLESSNCYILDTGEGNIYVWTGKNCPKNIKDEAMNKAQEYMKSKNYPAWYHIQRVVQQAEPTIFRQYFQSWQGYGELHPRLLRSVGDAPVSKLEDKSGGEAPEFMPDDGSGTKQVFVVEGDSLERVAENADGFLFGGDVYFIKYKTVDDKSIVYIWHGQNSQEDDKYHAYREAGKLSEELNGEVVIVRVIQNYESKHLLHIYKGKLVTFLGGHVKNFNGITDYENYVEGKTRLFRIRGTSPENTHANQMEATASSFESDDVFVVENGTNTWLWFGKECDEAEKEVAQRFATILAPGKTAVEVQEDEESDDFWDALGGQGEHNSSYEDDMNVPDESRLFHIHIRTGKVITEEIFDFTQDDLVEDDVMILETPLEVFIWIGKDANAEEKSRIGKKLKVLEEHNRENAALFFVNQEQEPSTFTSQFPSWDANFWETSTEKYADVKTRIAELNAAISDEE